ncbi:MAG: acyltransferase [Dermatophilus congolensis]|nr:acyltransferase [Dermatophilus congolensis]
MLAKDLLRDLRDGPVYRYSLRRAFPHAYIQSTVKFRGDVDRITLGDRVTIAGPSVVIVSDGGGLTGARLDVGEDTYIGEFNNIRCAGAPITIGRKCLISQHITIVGTNHGIEAGTPIVEQPWSGDGVRIGDDVWIGAGSVILPGARLGDGCVVAANSVVRGEVPEGAIVAGSIAKVIGQRS